MKDKIKKIWNKVKRPLIITSFAINALFSVLLVYSCINTPKEEEITLKTAKNKAYIPTDTSFYGFDISKISSNLDLWPLSVGGQRYQYSTDNLNVYYYSDSARFYKPTMSDWGFTFYKTSSTYYFRFMNENTIVQSYDSASNWAPSSDLKSLQLSTKDGSPLNSEMLELLSNLFESDLQVIDLNNWNPNVAFKQNTFVFHKSNLPSQSDLTYDVLQNSYFVFNKTPYTNLYTTYYTTANAFMLYGAGVPWNSELDGYHGVIYNNEYTFPVQVGFSNRYGDTAPVSNVMITDVITVAVAGSTGTNNYVENNSLNVLVKGLDKIYVPSVILKANNRINTALSNQDVLTANRDYIANVIPYGQDVLYGDVFGLIGSSFTGLLGFMNIALVPGLTIGVLIFIPLVVIIVFAIIRIIKK